MNTMRNLSESQINVKPEVISVSDEDRELIKNIILSQRVTHNIILTVSILVISFFIYYAVLFNASFKWFIILYLFAILLSITSGYICLKRYQRKTEQLGKDIEEGVKECYRTPIIAVNKDPDQEYGIYYEIALDGFSPQLLVREDESPAIGNNYTIERLPNSGFVIKCEKENTIV